MAATGWDALQLADHHRAMLQDCGVCPDVAAERGYRTATSPDEIPEVFGTAQRKLVPALVIPCYGVDETAEPVAYELRPDEPRVDGRSGKPRKYEYPRGQAKRLDVPRRVRPLLGDPAVPLWVTEGAKKADAAAGIGLACVSLAGVWNFRGTNVDGGRVELADFDKIAFNNRVVFICFDSDVIAKHPVRRAMTRLAGVLIRREATVKIVVLGAGPSGDKRGLDDVIAAGAREHDLLQLIDEDFLEDERGLDVRLRDHILDAYTLGRDSDGNGFALPTDGPRVVRHIYTGRPCLELEAPKNLSVADRDNPVVPGRIVKDVMRHIEGLCLDAPVSTLYLRAARTAGGIVLDLGEEDGRVVAVCSGGWTVVDTPPDGFPLFRRTSDVRPLPVPERGGSLDELRELLNVTDETWPLILGWLIAALFGWVPRPWLYHTGPQGSGKSDGAALVLNVLDPRAGLVPAPHKGDRHDPAAYAIGSYLLGYDNVSKVTPEFSDWLCALVTGTTESRRILHTTASMFSVSLMRTGVITGIGVSGIRPDLAERLVRVEFERIPTTRRKGHAKITERFTDAHPRILGALLDAVAGALAHLDEVDERSLAVPRMSDYAAILRAYDLGAGTDLFGAYKANVSTALAEMGEDDLVAAVVLDYLKTNGPVNDEPAHLFRSLSVHRNGMDLPEDAYWPRQVQGLTKALRELVAVLEDRVRIEFKHVRGRRRITITPVTSDARQGDEGDEPKTASSPPSSPSKPASDLELSAQGDEGDEKWLAIQGETNIKEDTEQPSKAHVESSPLSQRNGSSPPSPPPGPDDIDPPLPTDRFKIYRRPGDPTFRPSHSVTEGEEE